MRSLAVWNRAAGQLQRFPVAGLPVTNLSWAGTALYWRKDSAALLFGAALQDNPRQTALVELTLDGQATILARHGWPGPVHIYATGADGSLYYAVGQLGANVSQVERRLPDGRVQILQEGLIAAYADRHGHFVTVEVGVPAVRDLASGVLLAGLVPSGEVLSPDGRWTAVHGADQAVYIQPAAGATPAP